MHHSYLTARGIRSADDPVTKLKLQLEIAALADNIIIVLACYNLEGDRLEILLAHEIIENLRAAGRALGDEGTLPSMDKIMLEKCEIEVGTKVVKHWAAALNIVAGDYEAVVTEILTVQSDLVPGTEVDGFKIKYTADGAEETLEEAEIRPLISFSSLQAMAGRIEIVASLKKGYDYYESRCEGSCSPVYSVKENLEVFDLVRAFDPSLVVPLVIDAAWVDRMSAIECLGQNDVLDVMKLELPAYSIACTGVVIDRKDITAYTEAVLTWCVA